MTGWWTAFLATAVLAVGAIASAPAMAETYRCELEPTTLHTRKNAPTWIEAERTDNGAAFLLMTSVMDREGERPIRAKISREDGTILALTWRDNVRKLPGISIRYDFRLSVVRRNQGARLQGRAVRAKDKLDINARGNCRIKDAS